MFYLQSVFISISVALPTLAAATIAARFYARHVKKLPLGADDWTILATLIIVVADSAGCIYAVIDAGVGQLITLLSPADAVAVHKYVYAHLILIHLAYGLVKISAVLFYRRIFSVPWFRRVADVVLAALICWTIAAVLSAMFSAWPISDFWNHRGRTDLNLGAWIMTMAALDVFFDILVLALPLPAIRKLQISLRRKLSLIGIFWLGLFCIAASIARLYYSVRVIDVANSPGFAIKYPEYTTYVINGNTLWARIEACASIVAACLPPIAPLAQSAMRGSLASLRTWLSSSKTRGQASGDGGSDSLRGANMAGRYNQFDEERGQEAAPPLQLPGKIMPPRYAPARSAKMVYMANSNYVACACGPGQMDRRGLL